jgi:hypothetical protein
MLQLRLGSQVVAVDEEAEAAEKYYWCEIGGDDRGNGYGQGEDTIARGEILDDSGKQHIKESAADLVATAGARARGEVHLRDIFAAVGAPL